MKKFILIGALTLVMTTQAQASGWDRDAAIGGALGGATGAVIGSAIGGRDAAIIGGLLGGVTGVAIATNDRGYHRVETVHYRPAPPAYYREAPPPVYYRPAPVRIYERYDYGPRRDYGYAERVVYYNDRPRQGRGWGHEKHRHDRHERHQKHRHDHRDW